MKKKRRKKIVKNIILILFLTFIILLGISIFIDDNETNKTPVKEQDVLLTSGYNQDEADYINTNLSDETIQLLIENTYETNFVLSLIKSKYYIDEYFAKYMELSNKYTSVDELILVINSHIDKDFYTEMEPSDLDKGVLMIANKHYYLPESFDGLELVDVPATYSSYNKVEKLNKEAYEAYLKMDTDAKALGMHFTIYSAYRSYDTQNTLYTNYAARDGEEAANTYSAQPGSSEHQIGLAVDLHSQTSGSSYFEVSDEYAWLKNNAHKYGYIIRYTEENVYITGYQFEPWHYRYVGVEAATTIYEENISFEEYYEYYVK